MVKEHTNSEANDMGAERLYVLPELPYGYDTLTPHISEELLRIHHGKHHAAYVNGANSILQKMDEARVDNTDFDAKNIFKGLSFHIGGHLLHSLFWANLAPVGKGGGMPVGPIATAINGEYGSFDRFKKLFSQVAISTEGSGWATLTFCKGTKRPIIMQVEKHNANVYPMFEILMVLDIWEHAYYLDYKNDRVKFVEAFWEIVNWTKVNERLEEILRRIVRHPDARGVEENL